MAKFMLVNAYLLQSRNSFLLKLNIYFLKVNIESLNYKLYLIKQENADVCCTYLAFADVFMFCFVFTWTAVTFIKLI